MSKLAKTPAKKPHAANALLGSAPAMEANEHVAAFDALGDPTGERTDQQPHLTISPKLIANEKSESDASEISTILKVPTASMTPPICDQLLGLIREALGDAEQKFFVAGDGINHLRKIPRPQMLRPMYSLRDIAKLLGFWKSSFISKLSTVAGDCDDEARTFALDNRIGWQTCYEICAKRRRLESDKNVIELLKEHLAKAKTEARPSEPDSTERALKRLSEKAGEGEYKRAVGVYTLRLYKAAKRWVQYQAKTSELELQRHAFLELRKVVAEKIRQNVTLMSRSLGADDMVAEADFDTIVEYIKRPEPKDELDPFDLEGQAVIRKKFPNPETTLSF